MPDGEEIPQHDNIVALGVSRCLEQCRGRFLYPLAKRIHLCSIGPPFPFVATTELRPFVRIRPEPLA